MRQAIVALILWLATPSASAWAVCSVQGPAERPEVNYRGWQRDSVVAFDFDASAVLGDKAGCIADGVRRWNGVNGVTIDERHLLVQSPTAVVTLTCCMSPSNPQWNPNVVAYVDGANAQRSGTHHIVNVQIQTGPAWNAMLSQLDCESFRKVLAHETAHTFGLGHTPSGSGNLTQAGFAIGPNGTTPGWNGFPSDCEKDRAKDALTARTGLGGNPLQGDQACEKDGFPGYGDNKNCCRQGVSFVVQPDNVLPSGHITTLNNTKYPIGASGELTIHAYDLDSHIERVGWYVNGVLTYTSFAQPFSAPFQNAPAGVYSVQAAIYDDSSTGAQYVWADGPITITVGNYFATDTLQTKGQLPQGYVLVSPNQGYYLQLQADGRLNFYSVATGLIASTGTYGAPLHLRMDEDGNLVLRHQPFNAVWQTLTGSWNNREAALRVLDTGKLALIKPNGATVWQFP